MGNSQPTITITNSVLPLNDQFEIIDDRNGWTSTVYNNVYTREFIAYLYAYFKNFFGPFKFLFKFYNFLVIVVNVLYYIFGFMILTIICYWGWKLCAFICLVFIRIVKEFFQNFKLKKNIGKVNTDFSHNPTDFQNEARHNENFVLTNDKNSKINNENVPNPIVNSIQYSQMPHQNLIDLNTVNTIRQVNHNGNFL